MDCHAREDQILLYALDDLSGPERDELRAHLQTGCPYCQGQLAQANAMLDMLPLSLPPAMAPQTARQRLLERITGKIAAQNPLPHKAAKFALHRRILPWVISSLASGAVASGITVLIYANLLPQTRKSLDIRQKIMEKRLAEAQQLLDDVRIAQENARLSGIHMMNLTGQGAQPMAKAGLIWEQSHKMLIFHAEDLKTLQPGRAYELWLVNSDRKAIPAGMFKADAQGHGMVVEQLQMDPGLVVTSAVSEEPDQGAANPTSGNILLMSKPD